MRCVCANLSSFLTLLMAVELVDKGLHCILKLVDRSYVFTSGAVD